MPAPAQHTDHALLWVIETAHSRYSTTNSAITRTSPRQQLSPIGTVRGAFGRIGHPIAPSHQGTLFRRAARCAAPDQPASMKKSGSGGSGPGYVRHASHAGSWYSKDEGTLADQLNGWLEAARRGEEEEAAAAAAAAATAEGPVRAIIAPHAGFSYSGPTAAFAYMHLDAARVRRIFVIGPSHHVYLKACAVSGASVCETPVGDLQVDEAVRAELLRSPLFQRMGQSVDEDEHSIEMHLPYVAQVVKGREGVTVVPIMVGAIDAEQEAEYGQALAPYLQDPANFFVISSDFCHWGSRFRYQPYDAAHGATIGDYIEWLDRQGMRLIEQGDPAAFHSYLKEHHNTICGRHPIAVFMHAAVAHRAATGRGLGVRFVRYAQSSRCRSKQDSSVSYASALAREEKGGNGGGDGSSNGSKKKT